MQQLKTESYPYLLSFLPQVLKSPLMLSVFFLNPNWPLYSICLSSKQYINLLRIILSSILEN